MDLDLDLDLDVDLDQAAQCRHLFLHPLAELCVSLRVIDAAHVQAPVPVRQVIMASAIATICSADCVLNLSATRTR